MESVSVNVGHRPASPRRTNDHRSSSHNDGNKQSSKKSKLPVVSTIIGVLILIALVVLGVFMFQKSSVATQIDSSKYQAVFFTNGQVYFGKLESLNSDYFKLSDIFYLQSKETDGTNPQKTDNEAPNIQLTKLGNELHGPTDAMIMNKDQIFFFENLKSDGKVSAAIEKYNSTNK